MAANHDVVNRFASRLEGAIASHRELLLAIYNKKNEASLETLLSEQFVLLITVLWEAFITDLLIAYVTRDSRVCVKNLQGRIVQSVTERMGSEAAKALAFQFPVSLTRTKAAALLDPKKWNISYSSAEGLAKRANTLIAAPHAKKFSLGAEDSQFLDFGIALRNYLSHRSDGARETLKQAINRLSGAMNASLTGPASNIGSYLKFKNAAGDSRAILIAQRFRTLALSL